MEVVASLPSTANPVRLPFNLQLKTGVLRCYFPRVGKLSYELSKLVNVMDVVAEGYSAFKLAEAHSLWIFGEEGAEGLLLLHVMRVEDDGQFLKAANYKEGI